VTDTNREVGALHRDALTLDAAAPFISPHRVERHLPHLLAGQMDAVLATVASIEGCRHTTERLGAWIALERSGRLPIQLTRSVAEMREAKRNGKLAVVFHLQGTDPIENAIDLLDAYQALGVRVVQMTYNARNLVGDGCLEPGNAGLSAFGHRVARRVAALNMLVDISHVGVRSSLEAIEGSQGKAVATHANARAVCDSPRNLTDEQIRAVAAAGGVIGLVAFPAFVSGDPHPTVDDLLRHAEYLSSLVGPEHVGLGFDFSQADQDSYDYFGYDERYYPRPPWTYPTGIGDWSEAPNITAGLHRRGFSEPEIRGILGENFLRVFERVWGG
jgi:membrane dipeptidase